MTTTVDRAAYISGLRKFADLLAEHEEIPFPLVGSEYPLTVYITGPDTRATLRTFAELVGPVTIEGDGYSIKVVGAIDGLIVAATIYPTTAVAEKTTVTTSVDTVEWTLHPDVLAPAVDAPLAVEALAE